MAGSRLAGGRAETSTAPAPHGRPRGGARPPDPRDPRAADADLEPDRGERAAPRGFRGAAARGPAAVGAGPGPRAADQPEHRGEGLPEAPPGGAAARPPRRRGGGGG